MLKLLLKIVLGLILTIVIAIGALFAFVDPNDYRQEITDIVQEQTGRELKVGNMSLSVWPHLAINLEQASLSNAEGFAGDKMLQANVISVGAAIMPLLQQRLEIDQLTLDGVQVTLQKNAEGKTNWDDLVGSETEQETEQKDDSPSENPLDKLAALSFGGLNIQNGQVQWQDATTGQDIKLSELNITTGTVSFGEFFPINIQATTTLNAPQLTTKVDLNIEAKVDKNGAYAVRNLVLNNQTESSELPVSKVLAELSIPTIDLNLAENQINLPEMTLDLQNTAGTSLPLASINNQVSLQNLSFNLEQMLLQITQVKLATQAKGKADFAIADLDNTLQLNDFSFAVEPQQLNTTLASNTNAKGSAIPAGLQNAKFNANINVDLGKQTLAVQNLDLAALNLAIKGSIKGSQIIDAPQVNTQLVLAQFDLKQLLTSIGIELPPMADANRLQKVSADLAVDFNGKNEAVAINVKQFVLDDSSLKGKASIANFSKPQVRYDLALDKIDANLYLPPKSDEPVEEEPKSDEELVIELPNELIRSLDINGTLKVGDLTIDKLNPKNILVTVKAKDGIVNVAPLKADLFKTTINAKAGLDVTQDTPKYSVQTNAPKVPVGDVLMAFTGDDKLSGLGSVDLNLTTSGKTIKEFMANLNGRTDMDLADGAVKGFNLAQTIRDAQAKLKGEATSSDEAPKQTDFSSLIAKANIVNGLVTTEQLQALAPYMRVEGEGTINLAKESLNYLVNAKIVSTEKGQGGKALQDLKGLTVPVRLKGNWMDPDISLDLKSLFAEKAKAELEKKKAELKAKAEEKIEEKKQEVIDDAKKKVEEQMQDKLKDALKGFGF
ncbi:AsmA family protein [Thiomicrorhabdus sp. 6S2-11]|uniref:AsmA family protein n=1 Tax=Thiomicrorhabdus marina TaxID=2818442 RepID=A0ABS3Q1D1_9GAMM|nr:AsmA family protein [Thiomicrorhabdus marina]MBO1926086.1 AsmA family protein [Thiomicrorhabdus marina]